MSRILTSIGCKILVPKSIDSEPEQPFDSVPNVSSLYFHLNPTGSSFTSRPLMGHFFAAQSAKKRRYNSMRAFSSAFELTRIPLSRVFRARHDAPTFR